MPDPTDKFYEAFEGMGLSVSVEPDADTGVEVRKHTVQMNLKDLAVEISIPEEVATQVGESDLATVVVQRLMMELTDGVCETLKKINPQFPDYQTYVDKVNQYMETFNDGGT